jgi:hypothetical protein
MTQSGLRVGAAYYALAAPPKASNATKADAFGVGSVMNSLGGSAKPPSLERSSRLYE